LLTYKNIVCATSSPTHLFHLEAVLPTSQILLKRRHKW
jgi:hypothetical protein